jgi:hypothetical protein
VIHVDVGGPSNRVIPRLGIGLPTVPADDDVRLAATLRPSFLQLRLDAGRQLPDVARVRDAVAASGCELEIHITTPVPSNVVARLGGLPQAARLIAVGEGIGDLEDAGVVELARRLGATAIGVGTDTYFVNLNRNRPASSVQVVSWPVDPQAHASDDLSVMENTGSLADLVVTARSFAPSATVTVGPISLGAASSGDRRMRSRFAAAWTVAALASLTDGGADVASFFELTGPAGIADEQARLLPVGELLSALALYAGADAVSVSASSPEELGCLGVHVDETTVVVLANLTNRPRTCALDGIGHRSQVRWIRADTSGNDHGSARGGPADSPSLDLGRLGLEPFGVAIVTASA